VISISALFLLLAAGIAGWWFFASQLTARPWDRLQRESDDKFAGGISLSLVPERIGLWVLLAVVTSLFGLFISAYRMRMMLADWTPFADPSVLWLNTLLLVLSSAAFQWTEAAAKRGDSARTRLGLVIAGLFALAFLYGQLVAWGQLEVSGEFPVRDAAKAFFYLLTGVHALHVLGGLAVWGKTTARMWIGEFAMEDLRLSVQLCTVYWHYLLIVWLVLFALLLTT
jgi:cytochrome c oxidase subunit 3